MKTIENIKKVALAFFLVTGVIHLGSNVLIANELYLKQAEVARQILDIPFILTGLIYGFSSIRISLTNPNENHKILDIFFIIIILLALISLIIINLFIPNFS